MQRILKIFLMMLILALFINCYIKDLIPITELNPNCEENILSAYSKTGESFTFPKKDGRCSNSSVIGKTESGVIVHLPFAELSAVEIRISDGVKNFSLLSIILEVIGIVLIFG